MNCCCVNYASSCHTNQAQAQAQAPSLTPTAPLPYSANRSSGSGSCILCTCQLAAAIRAPHPSHTGSTPHSPLPSPSSQWHSQPLHVTQRCRAQPSLEGQKALKTAPLDHTRCFLPSQTELGAITKWSNKGWEVEPLLKSHAAFFLVEKSQSVIVVCKTIDSSAYGHGWAR